MALSPEEGEFQSTDSEVRSEVPGCCGPLRRTKECNLIPKIDPGD